MRVWALGVEGLVLLLAVTLSPSVPQASAQPGNVFIEGPRSDQTFDAGDDLAVFGRVVDFAGIPLGGARLRVHLLDSSGLARSSAPRNPVSSSADGRFFARLTLPEDLAGGSYALLVDAEDGHIADDRVQITVRPRLVAPPASVALPFLVGGILGAIVLVALLRRTARRRRLNPPPNA